MPTLPISLEDWSRRAVRPRYRLVRNAPLCPDRATLEERAGYRNLFIRLGLNGEIEQADVDAALKKLSGGNVVDIV